MIIGLKANVAEIAATYQAAYPNARIPVSYTHLRGGRTDIPLRTRKEFPQGRYSLLQGAYP